MLSNTMIPPHSDAGRFAWRERAGGRVLVCTALEPFAPHFFTTSEWRLGSAQGSEAAGPAWAEIAAAFGSGAGVPTTAASRSTEVALVRLRQVHGRDVIVADGPRSDLPAADLVLTKREAVAIAVQAADCVPLLAVDRRTGAVGAAHAGWRGMAEGVPGALVEAFASRFSSRAPDLLVAAGPSIGACCYEVGEDVREAFSAAGFDSAALERWFRPARPGHWMFDGWACIGEQLAAAAVPASQIFLSRLCTFCDGARWPSYRRDGARAGRLAAAIRARSSEAGVEATRPPGP